MRPQLFILPILIFFFSCTNKKNSNSTDAVYADYKITGEEGTENIICLLKFYQRNSRGASLFLEPPAGVSFDGTALQGDSAGLSGAYYELQKPVDSFAGMHTIIFKNADGREYKETFNFQPFTLENDIAATVPRGDIVLQLDGFKPTESIRVLLTDTSFNSKDINETATVKNGQLTISQTALRNVASGPVTLYLFKEEERGLQQAPAGGGRLSITYGLSREFELVDE